MPEYSFKRCINLAGNFFVPVPQFMFVGQRDIIYFATFLHEFDCVFYLWNCTYVQYYPRLSIC